MSYEERMRALAATMHDATVRLWNLAHAAEHGRETYVGDFPERESIEAMQRTLAAIAWPPRTS